MVSTYELRGLGPFGVHGSSTTFATIKSMLVFDWLPLFIDANHGLGKK